MYLLALFGNALQRYMDEAVFDRTQRGYRCLVIDGYQFVKDRLSHDSINWRCSHFQKHKCKARAVSKIFNGVEMVKITNSIHTHLKLWNLQKLPK
uniref:FLYWCH-type domain-containing protein n=1 Tax=Lutzomyia longipalpis TaxID=7200 RepID=A0A1B0GHA3_LUTLO